VSAFRTRPIDDENSARKPVDDCPSDDEFKCGGTDVDVDGRQTDTRIGDDGDAAVVDVQ